MVALQPAQRQLFSTSTAWRDGADPVTLPVLQQLTCRWRHAAHLITYVRHVRNSNRKRSAVGRSQHALRTSTLQLVRGSTSHAVGDQLTAVGTWPGRRRRSGLEDLTWLASIHGNLPAIFRYAPAAYIVDWRPNNCRAKHGPRHQRRLEQTVKPTHYTAVGCVENVEKQSRDSGISRHCHTPSATWKQQAL